MDNKGSMNDIEVYTDENLGKTEEAERTIIDRLFSFPWNQLKTTKTIFTPSKRISLTHNEMTMHPNTFKDLKEFFKGQ